MNSKRETNPLPWQEESVTRNREAGKSLIMLQKQNASLRAELVKLNEQLNEVIYETQQRKAAIKVVPQTDTSPQELENAKKRLEVYMKQLEKVKTRYSQLQDPGYEVSLQQNISSLQREVQELEAWLKNAALLKTRREKILDSVLETGETPEMVRAMGDALSEFKVAASKNMQLERAWENAQKNHNENLRRVDELRPQIQRMQAKLARMPSEPDKKLMQRIEEASKTKAGAEKQLYNVGAKLKVKLTTAEKKLASLREQEASLSEQLNQKAEALTLSAGELTTLHQAAVPSKKQSKKSLQAALPKMPDSKNLFLTEGQYSDREYMEDF
eukprot:CAMPEP_0204911422 /NCGR_PEP_ID=MMETSP1397-20131031/9770_1 /ASSEMBLY_ACC=CAM_ASM_000891 /TAXON_ID=49980 /ORGANISM="Climacostomum Climacostomum virens, Strain Stock W-24" /LENGTH=327 /DNA_ID=CAMNT_0052081971 /DNA_START=77 /DNA_END=1060 /DNA_ORIENTATION=-